MEIFEIEEKKKLTVRKFETAARRSIDNNIL